MGILSTIFGGGIAAPVTAVGNVLDELFTSDDERLTHEEIQTRLAQKPHLAQIELNKVEASHRSIFVAGWRPFIGWVSGFGLAWHFLFYDALVWIQVNFIPQTTAIPELTGTKELISLVFALLGLGTLRTVEKINGRAK